MSFAFVVMTMLLGSSMVIAFVLQPSKEEAAASVESDVSHHRCHHESLQSIRKSLLRALNLQVEPQLPAGGLDAVREQWRSTFSNIAHRAKVTVVPASVSGYSVSPDAGNNTELQCCSVASEIFMTDLGWDSWVIHPVSLTMVKCALCNPETNSVHCLSSHTRVQDGDPQVQVPCCQPALENTVPVVYLDESNSVVISSVQLTHSCSCRHSGLQLPSQD